MSWFGHHHHNQPAPPAAGSGGPNQVFKIFCRGNENYCLAVRDGAVVLAPDLLVICPSAHYYNTV